MPGERNKLNHPRAARWLFERKLINTVVYYFNEYGQPDCQRGGELLSELLEAYYADIDLEHRSAEESRSEKNAAKNKD